MLLSHPGDPVSATCQARRQFLLFMTDPDATSALCAALADALQATRAACCDAFDNSSPPGSEPALCCDPPAVTAALPLHNLDAMQQTLHATPFGRLACVLVDANHPDWLSALQLAQQQQPEARRILLCDTPSAQQLMEALHQGRIWRVQTPQASALAVALRQAYQEHASEQQRQQQQQALQQQSVQQQQHLRSLQHEVEQLRERLTQQTLWPEPAGNAARGTEREAESGAERLRNRHFLQQQMASDTPITLRRHEEWLRRGKPGSLIDTDLVFFHARLDHFSRIQQHYGAAASDAVLQQMRARMSQLFRETDYLVHWDAATLLVVARATNRGEAGVLAERIRNTIGSQRFVLPQQQSASLTCSVGFAPWPFIEEQPRALDWQQVVELASQALQLAKEHGRNAWVGLYATGQTDPAQVLAAVRHDCANAAQCGQVHLVKSLEASDR